MNGSRSLPFTWAGNFWDRKVNAVCRAYLYIGFRTAATIMRMSTIDDRAHDTGSRGIVIMPRVLRLRDAPSYLGMNRNLFNAEIRPYLTELRIGRQGVAFDRLELDAWWEQYKSRNGRPAARRNKPWDE